MTAVLTVGCRVIAYRDYWHEDPYGEGLITRFDGREGQRDFWRVRLDTPTRIATRTVSEVALDTQRIEIVE